MPGCTQRDHQYSTNRLIPSNRERAKSSVSDVAIVPESYSSSNSSSYSVPFPTGESKLSEADERTPAGNVGALFALG